jgi:hypothetical protein
MRITAIKAAALFFMFGFTTLATANASAQGGGKAEPKRIVFAEGTASRQITGRLSNGQEYELVFAARQGQEVTIVNSNTGLFDIRVFNEEFDFETEFDSSRTLSFTVPGTGDYLLFIRKKMVKAPRSARFSIRLTIR